MLIQRSSRVFLAYTVVWSLVLLLCAPMPTQAQSLHDEWEPIDRITVHTQPNGKLNPLAEKAVAEAVKAGLKVVIVDGNAAAQKSLLDDLKKRGVITKDSDVAFTDSPHTTEWARDEAPITTYGKKASGLTSTAHTDKATSDGIGGDVAKATGQSYSPGPTVTNPPGSTPASSPLFLDGGDLMTTDGGKTLITTTNLYLNNGGKDNATRDAVNSTLKDAFGIDKVIDLTPLDPKADGYDLSNSHVDLGVRTLPGNKVIVATVPKDDPQKAIIDANIKKLKDAGQEVIEVPNAPKGDSKGFKTYSNALFLNKTVVIPKYGDKDADEAARKAYDKALNDDLPPNDARRFKIVQVDASGAVDACGGPRCSARELGRTASLPAGKEASSKNNPSVSYDATTGALLLTMGRINFLGDAGSNLPDVAYLLDPLRDATLQIDGLLFDPLMSVGDRFAFVGGKVRVTNGITNYLSADVPVLSIFGSAPAGTLSMFGVLGHIDLAFAGSSGWLDDFTRDVIDQQAILADFFMSAPVDLIGLSHGFTTSFNAVELNGMGIVGNVNLQVVPEPKSLVLLLTAFAFMAIARPLWGPPVGSSVVPCGLAGIGIAAVAGDVGFDCAESGSGSVLDHRLSSAQCQSVHDGARHDGAVALQHQRPRQLRPWRGLQSPGRAGCGGATAGA